MTIIYKQSGLSRALEAAAGGPGTVDRQRRRDLAGASLDLQSREFDANQQAQAAHQALQDEETQYTRDERARVEKTRAADAELTRLLLDEQRGATTPTAEKSPVLAAMGLKDTPLGMVADRLASVFGGKASTPDESMAQQENRKWDGFEKVAPDLSPDGRKMLFGYLAQESQQKADTAQYGALARRVAQLSMPAKSPGGSEMPGLDPQDPEQGQLLAQIQGMIDQKADPAKINDVVAQLEGEMKRDRLVQIQRERVLGNMEQALTDIPGTATQEEVDQAHEIYLDAQTDQSRDPKDVWQEFRSTLYGGKNRWQTAYEQAAKLTMAERDEFGDLKPRLPNEGDVFEAGAVMFPHDPRFRTDMQNFPRSPLGGAGQGGASAPAPSGPPGGGGPAGLIEPGNVNLSNRPRVKNQDGSISTVRSMSFEEDGQEILVPTISDDGRVMSDAEAIDQYHRTGKHLGKFKDVASANAYAQQLHEDQARGLQQPGASAPAQQAQLSGEQYRAYVANLMGGSPQETEGFAKTGKSIPDQQRAARGPTGNMATLGVPGLPQPEMRKAQVEALTPSVLNSMAGAVDGAKTLEEAVATIAAGAKKAGLEPDAIPEWLVKTLATRWQTLRGADQTDRVSALQAGERRGRATGANTAPPARAARPTPGRFTEPEGQPPARGAPPAGGPSKPPLSDKEYRAYVAQQMGGSPGEVQDFAETGKPAPRGAPKAVPLTVAQKEAASRARDERIAGKVNSGPLGGLSSPSLPKQSAPPALPWQKKEGEKATTWKRLPPEKQAAAMKSLLEAAHAATRHDFHGALAPVLRALGIDLGSIPSKEAQKLREALRAARGKKGAG